MERSPTTKTLVEFIDGENHSRFQRLVLAIGLGVEGDVVIYRTRERSVEEGTGRWMPGIAR